MSHSSGDASITGQAEEKETTTTSTTTEPAVQRPSPSSSTSQPTTALPTLRKQLSTGRLPTPTTSANPSPRTSRNTSPLRKDTLKNGLSIPQTPSQPSSAAIQRALSASNVPQLAKPSDASTRPSRLQRNVAPAPGDAALVSPRLNSPEPSSAKRANPSPETKNADSVPSITVQQSTTTEKQVAQSPRHNGDTGKNDQQLQTPVKTASRGPSGKSVLATVDEDGSDTAAPLSPAVIQATADLRPLTKVTDEDKMTDSDRPAKAIESGSESGGNKSDGLSSRRASQSQPPKRSKNSYTSLSKARPPESTHNMTVETETVQSIPHSGLSTGDRNSSNRTDGSGTVRMKSSNETIRPKKERKQATKKTRSINQGNASSKADIFEARVANAVDEANSSDSDETFVYESNPPEPRRTRHHSRTPSVTSAHSVADGNRGIRGFGDAMDDRRVAGKRSMKFSNNPFHSSDSHTDRQDGTVRSHHARHYGRWGRGGSHASMFEPDSPFTQASKLRSNPHSARHSGANSPRSPQTAQSKNGTPVFGKKRSSPFDFDLEGADDERTPLMGSVRTPRSARGHLHSELNSPDSSIDTYYGVRRRNRCGTLGSFLLGVLIFILVVVSTIGFLIASNQPLSAVQVLRIQNVLASEQELLLDLRVTAINPNALGITITDTDLSILGKSKYTHSPTGEQSDMPAIGRAITASKGGHGDDPDPDAPALLSLGHISHFDQALEFPGSPLRRLRQFSVGEIHLSLPGNKTGTDGSARWGKMVQQPFELLVRGVLKYKLPISSREENTEIAASIIVHPEDGIDALGRMRLEPVDHSDHWQWIDWDQEKEMLGEISSGEVAAFE